MFPVVLCKVEEPSTSYDVHIRTRIALTKVPLISTESSYDDWGPEKKNKEE
jgi:hypothetical protein